MIRYDHDLKKGSLTVSDNITNNNVTNTEKIEVILNIFSGTHFERTLYYFDPPCKLQK